MEAHIQKIGIPRSKNQDIEIPRPKNRDIEIRGLKHHGKRRQINHNIVIPRRFFQRTKSHDIEIPRPKSHDIEFLWNSDPDAP